MFDSEDKCALIERESVYEIDANLLLNYRADFANFPKKRAILIDWMQEVSSSLGFKRETFHQSVGILDRFFVKVQEVNRNQLQLVGATALLIAHKIEVSIQNL